MSIDAKRRAAYPALAKSPALLDSGGQIEETTVRVSHTSQALRTKPFARPENAAPELCVAVIDDRVAFTFHCSVCGKLILEPPLANLIWNESEAGDPVNLRAVHKHCDHSKGTCWTGLDCVLRIDQRGPLTRLLDGEASIEAMP